MRAFIAYSSEARDTAEKVYLRLVESRHKVFFDRNSLSPSSSFDARIRSAIATSDLFIFLISPKSVSAGSYTLTELKFAQEKWPHPRKSVLAALVQPTSLDLVPNYLKATTILEPHGDAAAEICAWVQARAHERSARMVLTFAAVAASLLLCACAWWYLHRAVDVGIVDKSPSPDPHSTAIDGGSRPAGAATGKPAVKPTTRKLAESGKVQSEENAPSVTVKSEPPREQEQVSPTHPSPAMTPPAARPAIEEGDTQRAREPIPPTIRVSYTQACSEAGNPLIVSNRQLAESIKLELGPRGSSDNVTVHIAAGYAARREGSGAGIVVAGQFRVCPPKLSPLEKCETPPADCGKTSCVFEFHDQQLQNRARAESQLAEAIAAAIESQSYEVKSVCSSR